MATSQAGDDQDQPRFLLRVLGSPAILAQNGTLEVGIGPGKSLAMLAFLDVRGQARRDELISLLWGDVPEAKARNAFRQSLHRVRNSFDESVVDTDRDTVVLRDRALLDSDRRRFVDACDDANWDAAVALYTGDFLEGFEVGEPAFDRWADGERLQLRSRFEAALRNAANHAIEHGKLPEAVRFAQRLAAAAPFDEHAAALEATVLIAAGRNHEALTGLKRFVGRLRDELDLPASPATQSMLTRLQRSASHATASPRAADASSGKEIPFVGRDAELSKLIGALNGLRSEQGATVFIEGAAGDGKTRLIDEFLARARTLGRLLVLRGREHALGATLPYASVAEALRPIVRAPGVAGASRHLLAEAARLLPELRDHFELPAASSIEDEAGRLRFFEGIAATIDAAAYEQPICLALDDFHHASPSTADLVAYLSGRLRTSPVLFVIAYRPERAMGQSVDRVRRLSVETLDPNHLIVLTGLTDDESAALVRIASPRGKPVSPAEIERIVRTSDGRPAAILDLTRRGEPLSPASDALVSVRDSLWARVHALPPSQRRVFFAASLFERPTSLRLLSAAAHLPEPAAADAVESLLRENLLRDDGAGTGFALAHESTASFIHESGGLAGRAMLAGWAADALSQEVDPADAELARLYALAGQTALAFTHARRGAFSAAAVAAAPEAIQLLNLALTFAPDEHARREIDSLLSAFGRGSLRLEAGDSSPASAPASAPVADVAAATPPFDDELSYPPPHTTPTGGASVVVPQPARRHASLGEQWFLSIAISLIIVLLGVIGNRRLNARRAGANAVDSLLVVEGPAGGNNVSIVAGAVGGTIGLTRAPQTVLGPDWVLSLPSAWTEPLPSPNGSSVAIARVTDHGKDVYVISADRRDTVPVAIGGRENQAAGWSPDGRALLVIRGRVLPGGEFDSDLYVYRLGVTTPIPIDTLASRSIAEAKWSPTGTRIAWVGRTGATRQQDIFVAAPDGDDAHNVTAHPAEDFGIAWSPDGSLLEFTSTRSGARRVYAYDFDNARVWPVTDRDGDDHAIFSPDGRFIAFASTRDDDAAVYVTRPLGGTVTRMTPRGRQFSIAGWKGPRPPFVDRLRIIGPSTLAVGDTARYTLLTVDQYGAPIGGAAAEWAMLSASGVRRIDTTTSGNASVLRADSVGGGRLVASLRGWRADSLPVSVGLVGPAEFHDDFSRGIAADRWLAIGVPLPYAANAPSGAGTAMYPNGDVQWESGLLSRSAFELGRGATIEARMFAPFGSAPTQASLNFAVVTAVSESAIDRAAPKFQTLIGVLWDGESGSLTYSVGAQSSTDRALGQPTSHAVRVVVSDSGAITFEVDGKRRWSSSLHFLGDVAGARSQVWIGGRATTESKIAVTDVVVRIGRRKPVGR